MATTKKKSSKRKPESYYKIDDLNKIVHVDLLQRLPKKVMENLDKLKTIGGYEIVHKPENKTKPENPNKGKGAKYWEDQLKTQEEKDKFNAIVDGKDTFPNKDGEEKSGFFSAVAYAKSVGAK